MDYARHFTPNKTPQTEQADPAQRKNNAGGFSFTLTPLKQLERFLILGCEGGSYYATEKKMTIDNAKCVVACLSHAPQEAIELIASISDAGRAPKNDPAIFALAIAAADKNAEVRQLALAALSRVCRIPTHLFQFIDAVETMRGWGHGLRRAVAKWYSDQPAERLAHQLAKYQQRGGRSHRDVLRMCHAKPTADKAAIYRWAARGDDMGARVVKGGKGRRDHEYQSVGELPAFLAAFEELKTADGPRTIQLIHEHNFTHEMIDTRHKASADVWDALLQKMPPTAMIRNLGKMTSVGLLKPMSQAVKLVAQKLVDREALKRGRVHPIQMIQALLVYKTGHGDKGSLTWDPAREIVDALDAGFYEAFGAIEPSGKRTLLALDVSGSMGQGTIAGIPGLTPRVGSAVMSMVTARTEQDWHAVGFSSGMTKLAISPRQRLDDIVSAISGLPFDGTDCALPMIYALKNRLEVDTFAVYTDSETYFGTPHPHQALEDYRQKMGIPAKLVVVGMTATEFSVADPTDNGMLDCVGFDTAAPQVISSFSSASA